VLADSLSLSATLERVAPGKDNDRPPLAYTGEVWTDARGYATVALPRAAGLHADLDYELRAFAPAVKARVAAHLVDGRFTIETDEPHVKVVWRVRAGRPETRMKEER
jgi:hypothetical protein